MLDTAVLGTKDVMATIAVKDLDAARKFYTDTLGLQPLESQESEALAFKTGNSTVLVYRSQFAGTNRATAATWIVGNELEAIVRALKARGVTFEHYDLPGMKREGDLHVAGSMKAAWLKDPEGNILSLVTG